MHISRLFEIVYILLARGSVPARELAEKFEVSTRTIYRDIDILSGSGIPVYCVKGKNGGIRLMQDYVLSNRMLTDSDKAQILAALHSLSVSKLSGAQDVLDKLALSFKQNAPDWVEIDFSYWDSQSQNRINTIKEAILSQKAIEFEYYNQTNERTFRAAEPVQLWFKHQAWYLKAYCLMRGAPRVFKLGRMRDVTITERACTHNMKPGDTAVDNVPYAGPPPPLIVADLDEHVAFRAYDEFDERQLMRLESGGFRVVMRFPPDEWLFGYLLSYGTHLKVITPESIRVELKRRIRQMADYYT